MARNILLTSLSSSENDHPVRYFSAKKEFGYEYCDAILSVEASTKYALAHFDIDEIIVIGRNSTFDVNDDGRLIALQEGSSFYSADIHTLSAYSLYRYRIAQYIDELTIEQQENMELLPEEEQDKVIGFIQDFFKNEAGSNVVKKANRYFDTLARDKALYQKFDNELLDKVPGARKDIKRYRLWTKNYLYRLLKETGKLELLPVNEDVYVRFIPTRMSESGGEMVDIIALVQAIVGNDGEINLYVSLHSDDASDSFVVMNILEIMNTMPGGKVNVRKVFTVSGANKKELVGEIHDDTADFGITELVAANRSFLRYGKADMIVDYWEKCGEYNDRIASMVYAMRHIDVGLSMCNMREVEDGIMRLRELIKGSSSLDVSDLSSRIFDLIAEGIIADYGPLLQGDEISFLELVKWAYRHGFYQQTLTLIESRAPKNLVDTGIFYYCDDENEAAQVTRVLALKRLELKPYEYYKMDDIDHYFIKTYDRGRIRGKGERNADPQETYAVLRTESLTNTDPDLITAHTACDNTETVKNLLYAYYHIGMVRNKTNHADDEAMAESRLIVAESDDSLALCWLKESIDYFILTYMKAREELKGKKPNVVKITSSDVRICAEQMRHEGLSWEKTKEKEAEFASIINTEKNTVTNAETEINAGTNTEKTDIGTNTEKRTNTGTNTETRKNTGTNTETRKNTGMSTGTKTENGTQKKNGNSKNVRRRRRRKKPETGNGAS